MSSSASANNNSNGGVITSAKIILFAQGLSVTASVAGLIGLLIAYRLLTKGQSSAGSTTRIPTIT